MPLIPSGTKTAIGQNIGTEINSGKTPKEAAAIAYSVARKNGGRPATKPETKIKNFLKGKFD